VSHEGLRELTFALADVVTADRAARPDLDAPRIVLRPAPVDDAGFSVATDPDLPGGYVVRGEKPVRWVRQTDFDNDEAVGYLADRLNRLGVEQRLLELGAEIGADVVIGDDDDAVVFEFDPQVQAGAEALHGRFGRRGQDPRLDHR
jgi:GTP-binding protein